MASITFSEVTPFQRMLPFDAESVKERGHNNKFCILCCPLVINPSPNTTRVFQNKTNTFRLQEQGCGRISQEQIRLHFKINMVVDFVASQDLLIELKQ